MKKKLRNVLTAEIPLLIPTLNYAQAPIMELRQISFSFPRMEL